MDRYGYNKCPTLSLMVSALYKVLGGGHHRLRGASMVREHLARMDMKVTQDWFRINGANKNRDRPPGWYDERESKTPI